MKKLSISQGALLFNIATAKSLEEIKVTNYLDALILRERGLVEMSSDENKPIISQKGIMFIGKFVDVSSEENMPTTVPANNGNATGSLSTTGIGQYEKLFHKFKGSCKKAAKEVSPKSVDISTFIQRFLKELEVQNVLINNKPAWKMKLNDIKTYYGYPLRGVYPSTKNPAAKYAAHMIVPAANIN